MCAREGKRCPAEDTTEESTAVAATEEDIELLYLHPRGK